jgi:ribosome assembly protein YihI (activator of Der GTPase)
MIKPDVIAAKLKSEIDSQSTGVGGGTAAMLAKNEFKNSIPSNGVANEEIIKKRIKKNNIDKLVGKGKLKTPIGKLTMGLPIMGEDGETSEATGAGSAGGFSAPLFSTTKKEMEEDCWKDYEQKGMKKKNGKMVPNCVKVNENEEEIDIKKVEATEATGSGSSGSYETTAAWAKSQNKKDWRGKSKTQIPGGKFVQVKKKCQKFPYCNQGDIKALKIFENEKVKKAIENISKRHNISENVIKTIIAYEYENTFSK